MFNSRREIALRAYSKHPSKGQATFLENFSMIYAKNATLDTFQATAADRVTRLGEFFAISAFVYLYK
jgi:hypothetical protein